MRAFIVVALVALSSTPAFAIARMPAPSCDAVPAIYPRDGATNVPRNARAWVFGGTLGDYQLRHGTHVVPLTGRVHEPFHIIEVPLGSLESETLYTLTYAGRALTTFTTGTVDDTTPPDPPELRHAQAISGGDASVGLIVDTRDDAGLVKLTVHTERGKQALLAPASVLSGFGAECAGLHLELGKQVCFDVAELDLAGNRSAASRQCTGVLEPHGLHHRSWCRGEPAPLSRQLIVLIAICVASFSALVFVFFRFRLARSAFTNKPLMPLPRELARQITIGQRRRAVWMLTACGAILLTLGQVPDVSTAIVLALMPLGVALCVIAQALRIGRVLASLDASDATASYDGSCYVFTQRRHWIATAPWELERAKKAAVPAAKIR